MRDTRSLVATNIERVDIRNSNAADLATEVRSQLLLSGVEISADADYSLRLVNEHYNRTVLTVSPVTGKVEEYTMTLTVALSIGKKGQEEILANDVITLSRDYLFDEDALLGKASEENVIRANLRQQAATAIIRRLNATINSI